MVPNFPFFVFTVTLLFFSTHFCRRRRSPKYPSFYRYARWRIWLKKSAIGSEICTPNERLSCINITKQEWYLWETNPEKNKRYLMLNAVPHSCSISLTNEISEKYNTESMHRSGRDEGPYLLRTVIIYSAATRYTNALNYQGFWGWYSTNLKSDRTISNLRRMVQQE
jgi:hypothetical protein